MTVQWLERIEPSDERQVGKKASALSAANTAGLNVPRFFVVTTETFEDAVRSNGLENRISTILNNMDSANMTAVRDAADRISAMIHDIDLPEDVVDEIEEAYERINMSEEVRQASNEAINLVGGQREIEFVAVRNSPTGTRLPGIHASELNVNGKSAVINAIKAVWASLYSAEALATVDDPSDIHSMAVIVQRMVEPDAAGVVYDSSPVRQESVTGHLIEAVYGLGSALAAGEATPDMYRVDSNGNTLDEEVVSKEWRVTRDAASGRILKQRLATDKRSAPVLNDRDRRRIVDSIVTARERIGQPIQLDFAISRNKTYILDLRQDWSATTEQQQDARDPVIKGRPASGGNMAGTVRILYSDADATEVSEGDIVVAVNAADSLLPIAHRVNGIVTDTGGLSANLAGIARHHGIPCIVGSGNATDMLANGEPITIDGAAGHVLEGDQAQDIVTQIPEQATAAQTVDAVTATRIAVLGPAHLPDADGAVIPEYVDQSMLTDLTEAYSDRVWARSTPHRDSPRVGVLTGIDDSDLDGRGVILRSYADVLRTEQLLERGAAFLGVDVESLRREGGKEALFNAIKLVGQQTPQTCDTALLLRDVDPDCIHHAIHHGVTSIAVPRDRVSQARRTVARSERRFMIDRLRNMEER